MKWKLTALALVLGTLFWLSSADVDALWKQESGSDLQRPTHAGNLLEDPQEDLFSGMARRVDQRLAENPQDHEARLLKGLLHFQSGDLNRALVELEQITRQEPNFHLAHLIQGDLLASRANQISDIGQNGILGDLAKIQKDQIVHLRGEAQARLKGYLSLLDDRRLPRPLLRLSSDVKSAVLVDKAQHRLYLFENMGPELPPKLIADFYCVIGKKRGNKNVRGDLRTPEGTYFITSHIDGARLPNRYGREAFPINYPNEFDRRLKKTGDGIWLHGTDSDFYSRPPLDSDGCVVLTNDDLAIVGAYLEPGQTPVVISERLEWMPTEEWLKLRNELQASVETWRQDWESNEVEEYLKHYAPDFRSSDGDLSQWKNRKRRIARNKTYQKVSIENLSIIAYPSAAAEGREMVVAHFRQHYDSNNFSSEMNKRLYLVHNDAGWQIWHEGSQ